MKRKIMKKITVIILSTVMLLSAIGGFIYQARADSYTEPSIILLEAMLNGDRSWVLDTIVQNDRSTNPYGIEESLMETALSQYRNEDDPDYNAVYSKMVDILNTFHYNNTWDDDLTTFVAENAAAVLSLFTDNDSFFTFVDDLKKTAEEEQYESILNGVFVDEYISSWGESINSQEASLRELNQFSDSIKNASRLTTYWKNLYTVPSDDDSALHLDYINNVLQPLTDSGIDFFKYFNELDGREQQVAGSIITLASAYTGYLYSVKRSEYYDFGDLDQDLIDYMACDGAKNLISFIGDKVNWASGLINQYTFLNSLASQKEGYYDTLLRLVEQADAGGEDKMSKVFSSYADRMDDAVDSNQLNYDLMIQAFSSTNLVSKELKISTAFKAAMPKALKDAYINSGLGSMATTFNIGMWVVDGATGIKNSCMKIYELTFLEKMIDTAVKVYENDLSVYQNNKTNENARKVLDDLMILQRLRLRGENVSYKMTQGQLNSGIGRLLSGFSSGDWSNLDITGDTDLAEAWKNHYQRSIDCLIGASLNPFSFETFELDAGDKLSIYYDVGKNTYTGAWTRDGQTNYMYEMQYRLLGDIHMTGGELLIYNASVPFIESSGGTIKVDAATASIGELTQTGTASIEVVNGDMNFANSLELTNTTLSADGSVLSTPDLTLTGTIATTANSLETEDLHLNRTNLTGADIICTGNVDDASSAANQLGNLTLNGNKQQNVTADIHTRDLRLDNSGPKGILLDGEFVVSGVLYDPVNILTEGLTLTETADIGSSEIASNVNLSGTNVSQAANFNRAVNVIERASLHGGNIRGKLIADNAAVTNASAALHLKNGIVCSDSSLTSDAPVNIYSEAYFDNASVTGTDSINLWGSTETAGENNTFDNLNLCGTYAQQIGFKGTVNNLNVSNSSPAGVTFNNNITITEQLTMTDQKISDGDYLILTGNAKADLSNVSGDLTISNWRGSGINELKGALYAEGENVISNNMSFSGGIHQKDGTFTVKENVSLTIGGNGIFNGSLLNNGTMEISGDTVWNELTAGKGTFLCSGDILAQQEAVLEKLICSGWLSQNISGSAITVNNLEIQGRHLFGITVDNTVTVTSHLSVVDEKITNGRNIIITGSADAEFVNTSSDLTMKDWSGDTFQLTGFKGTLYSSGTNTITNDAEYSGGFSQVDGVLNIQRANLTMDRTLIQNGGTIYIDAESSLEAKGDAAFQGTLQNDGTLHVAGDIIARNAVTGGGTIISGGDMEMNTDSEFGGLICNGVRGQTINGKDITVDSLELNNTSTSGVTLNAQIYVRDTYTQNGIVRGKKPIQILPENIISENKDIGSISTSSDTEVEENVEVTLKGDVNSTGQLLIRKGAAMTIQGNLILSSNTLCIEEGASLTVKGNVVLTETNVTLDGQWTIRQDAKLDKGTVSGTGNLILKGDLENNASIRGLNQISLSGKAPITISDADIHVGIVEADNSSTGGVELLSKIYYSEQCNIADNCKITGNAPMEETK